MSDPIRAELCGASTIPIRSNHPVESLRGKITLEFAIDPADLAARMKLNEAWELTWVVTPPPVEDGVYRQELAAMARARGMNPEDIG